MSGLRTSASYDEEKIWDEGGRPVTIRSYDEADYEYGVDDHESDGYNDIEIESDPKRPKNNENEYEYEGDNSINLSQSDASTEMTTEIKILGTAKYDDDDDVDDVEDDNEGCCSKKSRILFVIICLLCMVIILITTAVTMSKRAPPSNDIAVSDGVIAGEQVTEAPAITATNAPITPTMAPTQSERFYRFFNLVSTISGDRLDDESSPQSKALKWLVYGDDAKLALGTDRASHVLERYAVATFYYATDGENWPRLSDTFLSPDSVCDWNDPEDGTGVFCDDYGFVSRISLASNALFGTLPPELDFLESMETLDLNDNNLQGPIPDISSLNLLETLDVDGNSLKGSVPSSIFNLPSLRFLYLLNNQGLTGTIPNINGNGQLESISLYDCSLSGTIPESLSSIQTLRRVQFYNNSFTGTIPSSWPSGLESLALRRNLLKGSLPSFNGLASLSGLSVGENQLDGELPELQNLNSLEYLFLQDNQLEGTIPNSLASLPSLTQIWLSDNFLDGSVPQWSNSVPLAVAWLGGNRLSGSLHQFLQTAPDTLVSLDVSRNNLQGSLTSDLQKFTSLKLFNASNSGVSGNLPAAIGLLSRAEKLDFASNSLYGQIPSELGLAVTLKHLDLSDNFFDGSLPSSLGNLWQLTSLNISTNQIGYEFPSALTLNPNLERLSIEKNAISGNLTSLFCLRGWQPILFTADCDAAMTQCTCCTECFN